ncbi:MAG TPA: AI-2E family transporter [Planctomycetota bacterium]|nr:AI-2E family transporter [Planctomycetota bacterium]
MNESRPPPASTGFRVVIGLVLAVAALSLAKEVVMPVALALLASFLLAPVVGLLERWRMGRVPSVVIVVVGSTALLAGLGWFVFSQAVELTRSVDHYKENIRAKLEQLGGPTGGAIETAKRTLEELKPRPDAEELAEAAEMERALPADSAPVPVRVVQPPVSAWSVLREPLVRLLRPLGMAGIVLVCTFFMLLQREDLRERFIRVVGRGRLSVTTQAMNDAARRVSRYLGAQLAVNTCYGIAVGIGMQVIGVPSALMFGLMAMVVRFVPYAGPWIGAAMPVLLAVAVSDGWSMPLATVALFVCAEIVTNNLLEPWLYGARTGLSPMAVVISVIFWTWMWGFVGLLLATPLTVCVAVIARHVPQLRFLDILLGSRPGLGPGERVYQRLLAGDREGVARLAEQHLAQAPLVELYDGVLLPSLALAELDHHGGALDEERRRFVHESLRELLDELADRAPPHGSAAEERRALEGRTIAVIPVGEPDEIAGTMLAQLLERRGARAVLLPVEEGETERVERALALDPDDACVCAAAPLGVTPARHLVRRLRASRPDIPVVVALWGSAEHQAKARERLLETGAATVSPSLAAALEALSAPRGTIAQPAAPPAADAPERRRA